MLKKILIGLVVIIGILCVVIATRPATFRIERSGEIAAPRDIVFANVNDFHKWEAWSPWAKIDPNMKQTYEGPAAGVGAAYSWSGNDAVGSGKQTITESTPPDRVVIKLEFFEPMATTNTTAFDFKEEAGKTKVTWVMQGNNNFVGKAFGLVMNMDELVGKDFEKGLANLKEVSEKDAAAAKEAEAKMLAEKQAADAEAAQKAAEEQAAAEAAAKTKKKK